MSSYSPSWNICLERWCNWVIPADLQFKLNRLACIPQSWHSEAQACPQLQMRRSNAIRDKGLMPTWREARESQMSKGDDATNISKANLLRALGNMCTILILFWLHPSSGLCSPGIHRQCCFEHPNLFCIHAVFIVYYVILKYYVKDISLYVRKWSYRESMWEE